MEPAELTGSPATALAAIDRRAARRRREEVVEAHLARIEAVDGAVNAVVELDAERALAAARAADAALARGEPAGPLHGVPFTARTTSRPPASRWPSASPSAPASCPATDATAVARMRAAGAILLGKTNCPPYGGGIETDNAVYGRTNNPYDLDAHAGRQQRRRGGDHRRGRLAVRAGHRLGRERPAARRTSAGSPRSSRPRGASRSPA